MTPNEVNPPIPPIDCQQAQSLLDLKWDEGDTILSLRDEVFLDQHLVSCSDCKLYFQETQEIIHILEDLKPIPVPHDLADQVMARVSSPKKHYFWNVTFIRNIAAAAILVLVWVTAYTQWHPNLIKTEKNTTVIAQLPKQSTQNRERLAEAPSSKPSAQPPKTTNLHPDNYETVSTQTASHLSLNTSNKPTASKGLQDETPNESLPPREEPSLLANVTPQHSGEEDSGLANLDVGREYPDPVTDLVGF